MPFLINHGPSAGGPAGGGGFLSEKQQKFKRLEWDPSQPEVLGWGGFMALSRRRVRNRYVSGESSDWYLLETCHPRFMDAVVLLLHGPGPVVAMRRSLRPAACLLPGDATAPPARTEAGDGALWELPAGGVEPGDLAPGGAGIKGRAVAEAWEEAGLRLPADALEQLGPALFSAPAITPERLFFFAASVEPGEAAPPPGDGHPMEDGAELRFVPLEQALDWCRRGKVGDTKSEVGLRRLAEHLRFATTKKGDDAS